MVDLARIDNICQTLAIEHSRIMELVERVRNEPGGTRLLRRVKQLRELLIIHFAHEQLENGLYDTLDDMLVGHDEQLRELIEEHGAILESIEELLNRMTDTDSGGGGGPLPDLAALLEMISRHEQREQEFLHKLLSA